MGAGSPFLCLPLSRRQSNDDRSADATTREKLTIVEERMITFIEQTLRTNGVQYQAGNVLPSNGIDTKTRVTGEYVVKTADMSNMSVQYLRTCEVNMSVVSTIMTKLGNKGRLDKLYVTNLVITSKPRYTMYNHGLSVALDAYLLEDTPIFAVPVSVTNEEQAFENLLCKACLEKKCNIVLQPCGHVVICSDCINRCCAKCPVCRTVITSKVPFIVS